MEPIESKEGLRVVQAQPALALAKSYAKRLVIGEVNHLMHTLATLHFKK